MNIYIDAQCKNMIATTKVFVNACHLGAKQDDKVITREEQKQLRRIEKASVKFIANLEKITRK